MQSGQTIAGKYRLNRKIGEGGMASVWSATNIFTEREFAIKFMLPQVARTPEAARRFLLEAKISARINHPNIIEVIDVGQAEDGSLFLVMELLTGQSLETAIRRQKPAMRVAEFARFMLDVAKALAAAHASGVVHRDLKPTNVFLHKDREGTVASKILDFGVSKILEDETNHALTMAGTVLGSPLYMSPEQAMGAPGIDGRTDIFAFGSILFEALTASRAFDAANFNALIVTIATTQPKKIDDVAPHLPESLRAIVRDCMVTDRNKRIASFDRVVERLVYALPELEASPLRLPSPYGGGPPSDPDATNALPVMRGGAASAASLVDTHPPRSGKSPPGAFSTPWEGAPHSGQGAMHSPKWALLVGASGAMLAVAIVAIVVVAVTRGGESTGHALAASSPAQPSPLQPASAVASAASEPQVFSVDSLPVASSRRAPVRLAHLSVAAAPGFCTLAIDGVKQGPTPISSLAVTPGSHHLECTTSTGKVRAATVTVVDGASVSHRFTFDE